MTQDLAPSWNFCSPSSPLLEGDALFPALTPTDLLAPQALHTPGIPGMMKECFPRLPMAAGHGRLMVEEVSSHFPGHLPLGPGAVGRAQLGTAASSGPEGGLLTLVSFCRSPSSGMPRGATSRKSITWLRFFRMSWTSITPPLRQKRGHGTAPSVPAAAAAIKPAQSVGLS